MLKRYPKTKRTIFTLLTLITSLVIFGFWFKSLLPKNLDFKAVKKTLPQDISYIAQGVEQNRGKILAVVTSADVMGASGKKTGYELTELARAYYVFKANGFEIDIASPKGGKPPVVIDGDDMWKFDYAFMNDVEAQAKVDNSIAMENVEPSDYQAIYFVGGKGAMFDFPNNKAIQSIVRHYYQNDKVVGAVCHGPAALVNVILSDGTPLLNGKRVTSFTNDEELLLIPEAEEVFPFLLESKMIEQGATFDAGHVYLEQIAQDGKLVTGQNPWSVWALAESMVEQLGYQPVARQTTPEELTIDILLTYENEGFQKAKVQVEQMSLDTEQPIDRVLLAMHSIVSVMKLEPGRFLDMLRLLSAADVD